MIQGKGGFGRSIKHVSHVEWPQAMTGGIVDSLSKGWRQTRHSGNSDGSMASFRVGLLCWWEVVGGRRW